MPYVAAEVDVVKAVKAVMREHGRLDAVINNVDIASPHLSTTAQSLDGFERVLRIHLSGTLPDVRTHSLFRQGSMLHAPIRNLK